MVDWNGSSNGLQVESSKLEDAAISRLHPDLLWLIFRMNSEIPPSTDFHERLATARATSQVCRQWREVTVLRSSALWGRLIDLDLLHQPNWRDEVLARTGNSLLWIQGTISLYNREFFFTLLDQHWTRVQKLEVNEVSGIHDRNLHVWEALYRPARHLQTIRILLGHNDQESYPSGTLFSNAAPTLREFSASALRFNPCAPWLSGICNMTFAHHLTIPEIFEALGTMPLLECLSIRSGPRQWQLINPDNMIFPDLSQILLPRLTKLTLIGKIHVCLPFLACLAPRTGCSLLATISPMREAQSDPNIPTLLEVTSRHMVKYLRNYFTTHTMTRASLECSTFWVEFRDISDPNTDESPSYVVEIYDSQGLSMALLTELATPSFMTSVEMLHLDISLVQTYLNQPLTSLLALLHSVVNLETNDDALKFILKHFLYPFSLFPVLHTITAHRINNLEHSSQYPSGVFFSFMKKRKDAGFPVSVFDLTKFPIRRSYDMDFLEELTGLVVRWMQDDEVREYLCGSGSPHQLQFSRILRMSEDDNSAE